MSFFKKKQIRIQSEIDRYHFQSDNAAPHSAASDKDRPILYEVSHQSPLGGGDLELGVTLVVQNFCDIFCIDFVGSHCIQRIYETSTE